MERIFGLILLIMIGSGLAYLFIAFVVMPVLKILRENNRLKH